MKYMIDQVALMEFYSVVTGTEEVDAYCMEGSVINSHLSIYGINLDDSGYLIEFESPKFMKSIQNKFNKSIKSFKGTAASRVLRAIWNFTKKAIKALAIIGVSVSALLSISALVLKSKGEIDKLSDIFRKIKATDGKYSLKMFYDLLKDVSNISYKSVRKYLGDTVPDSVAKGYAEMAGKFKKTMNKVFSGVMSVVEKVLVKFKAIKPVKPDVTKKEFVEKGKKEIAKRQKEMNSYMTALNKFEEGTNTVIDSIAEGTVITEEKAKKVKAKVTSKIKSTINTVKADLNKLKTKIKSNKK